MIVLIVTGVISLLAVAATVHATRTDGYRRLPMR